MARRIQFGGQEHQSREEKAVHVHDSGSRIGGIIYFGDGKHVLAVCRQPKNGEAWCEVVGEDGSNNHGGAFVYTDYFLPEDMGLPRARKPAKPRVTKTRKAKGKGSE